MISCLVMASSICRSSGPEFPIHVVHPNPTRLKPRRSRNGCNPVLPEVLAHDARSGCERGLYPWLDAEPLLDRLLRQQTSSQHHHGVRGVGARSDGRDYDVAVRETRKPTSFSTCRLAWPSRFGVGRLLIISVSVSGLVFVSWPPGSVSDDCSPPPGWGSSVVPSRTGTPRVISAAGLP